MKQMEAGQHCLKEVLCSPLSLLYRSWNFLPVCSGLVQWEIIKLLKARKLWNWLNIEQIEWRICFARRVKHRKRGVLEKSLRRLKRWCWIQQAVVAEFERTVLKRELRTAAVEDGFGEWKVFSFLKEYWKNPPKANDSRKCGVNVLSAKLYLSALFYFQSCVTHSD